MDDQDKKLEENGDSETHQVVEVNDSTTETVDNTVESVSENESAPVSEAQPVGEVNDSVEVTSESQAVESTYADKPVASEEIAAVEAPVMTPVAVEKPKAKRNLIKTISIILLVWLIIAAPVGAYLWRDKVAYDDNQKKEAEIASLNAKVTDLQSQVDALSAAQSGACSEVKPSTSVLENIKASVVVGNTQPLEGYMASGVDVILAASEGIGETTPSEAVKNVTDFIENAGTWNFELDASTLASYANGDYKKYFPSTAVVGKSTSGKVISFSFDCTAKIGTVFLSTTEDVLN